jgi:hypothetical protein
VVSIIQDIGHFCFRLRRDLDYSVFGPLFLHAWQFEDSHLDSNLLNSVGCFLDLKHFSSFVLCLNWAVWKTRQNIDKGLPNNNITRYVLQLTISKLHSINIIDNNYFESNTFFLARDLKVGLAAD